MGTKKSGKVKYPPAVLKIGCIPDLVAGCSLLLILGVADCVAGRCAENTAHDSTAHGVAGLVTDDGSRSCSAKSANGCSLLGIGSLGARHGGE